jgi:Arc/MetJ-type ribon-helix-helix transcriptional regulator
MVRNLVEVKTRVPEKVVQFVNELVERGYYTSIADFARQAILDKLITDFELGITELEPDLVEREGEDDA